MWKKGENEEDFTIWSPSSKAAITSHFLQNFRREMINKGEKKNSPEDKTTSCA